MTFKRLLDQVPNDIGGDGKKYAAALKRFLLLFSNDIDDRINGANGVVITSDGLQVENISGAYVLFTRAGASFYNAEDELFAGVGRFTLGTAKDGEHVRFRNKWDIVPQIITIPTNLKASPIGYSKAEVDVVCGASNVSVEGFTAQAYSVLKAGAKGEQVVNEELVNVSVPESSGTAVNRILKVPAGATKLTANVSVFLGGAKQCNLVWTENTLSDGITVERVVSGIEESVAITSKAVVSLMVGDTTVETVSCENTKGVASMNSVRVSGSFNANDVVTLKVEALGESTDETQQGFVQAVLDSITYETESDYVMESGDIVFIATDDLSLGSTVL